MWGQTGRAPFLSATELKEKLVNVPSVTTFRHHISMDVPRFPGQSGAASVSNCDLFLVWP
jgi:hypothetical protein